MHLLSSAVIDLHRWDLSIFPRFFCYGPVLLLANSVTEPTRKKKKKKDSVTEPQLFRTAGQAIPNSLSDYRRFLCQLDRDQMRRSCRRRRLGSERSPTDGCQRLAARVRHAARRRLAASMNAHTITYTALYDQSDMLAHTHRRKPHQTSSKQASYDAQLIDFWSFPR